MRILITGADGFIGRHLVKALQDLHHSIICHTLNDGDISNPETLKKYSDIDHIFHLAARTFVPDSFEHPYDFFHTNYLGTVNVLEFCRNHSCSLTFMSTYVYGQAQYLPVDEKHPIVGLTPYHQSKIAGEELCEFYNRQFGVKVTILRPFNVYGQGQSSQFLIPEILRQILDPAIKEVQVMDLEPKRDYIFINDLIDAMILTMNSKKPIAIYNVGSGTSKSVEEVILDIQSVTGIYKPYCSLGKSRKTEVSDCIADISAIKSDFRFTPRFTLITGIAEMFSDNLKNQK